MPRFARPLLALTFGVACTVGGWTAAEASGARILRPKSTEAIALPALPDAPGRCDETRAGWIYLDTEVGNAAFPCVCVRNTQRVWDWVAVGAFTGKMCE